MLASPERSINIDDPTTAKELVNGISYTDFRKLSTPVSEFSYTGKVNSRFEMRGGYMFYRYQGPASLDMAFDGSARTNSGGTDRRSLRRLALDARARYRTQPCDRSRIHLQGQRVVEPIARLPLFAIHPG